MAHMTPEEFIDYVAIYPQNKVMGRSREAGFTDELHYSREDLYRLLSAYHDYTLEQAAEDAKLNVKNDKTGEETIISADGYDTSLGGMFSVSVDKNSILQHKFNK